MDNPDEREFDRACSLAEGSLGPGEKRLGTDEDVVDDAVEQGGASESSDRPIAKKHRPRTASKTEDVDALLEAVNHSADRFQTLWFSFLGLTLYLAITAEATTHRRLLLGDVQELPILNIKVDLLAFYVIAPLLYLVSHFYLLMMLVLLARTAAEFEDDLRKTLPIEADQERYRARVENALFLQLVVGMKDERSGRNTLLLASIAIATIVVAPIATLVLVQMMFLPYHSLGVTWWHRVLVTADLILLVCMWRRFFTYSRIRSPLLIVFPDQDRLRDSVALLSILGSFAFVAAISIWQGRWAGEEHAYLKYGIPFFGRPGHDAATLKSEGRPIFGVFPNHLILSHEILINETVAERAKNETVARGAFVATINLEGRNLEAAEFEDVDLREVSFEGANIRGSNLAKANLKGARLDGALMEGANLVKADLEGANLLGAYLQGATLRYARLYGADLTSAHLQGADLKHANLKGANLVEAHLEGADLSRASLRGADLSRATMTGMNAWKGDLQVAVLSGAVLQGAALGEAHLEGADLSDVDLSDAELFGTFVASNNLFGARTDNLAIHSVHVEKNFDQKKIDELIGTVKLSTHLERPPKPDDEADTAQAEWLEMEKASAVSAALDPAAHRRRLAKVLGDLACDDDGSDIFRGVLQQIVYPAQWIRRHRLSELGDQLMALQNRLIDSQSRRSCPGMVDFPTSELRNLDKLETIHKK